MRLAALARYVPEQRIEAKEIILSAGGRRTDGKVFAKIFGIERVAASDAAESLGQRFDPAFRRLARGAEIEPADALINVHGLAIQYHVPTSLV